MAMRKHGGKARAREALVNCAIADSHLRAIMKVSRMAAAKELADDNVFASDVERAKRAAEIYSKTWGPL